MSMQDKDMDELFRAKLDNVELEPSAKVWKGIVVELDGTKKKRTLIPIIRIAASVTVILGIGLFFLLKGGNSIETRVAKNTSQKKHGVITLTQHDDEYKQSNPLLRSPEGREITAEVVEPAEAVNRQKDNVKVKMIKRSGGVAANAHSRKIDKQEFEEPATELPAIAEPYTLAAATNSGIKITKAVVPDESLNDVKPVVETVDGFKTTGKPVVAQLPASKPNAHAKKHGLNSIGDLINVVVAKVDKRQDKVIEFSNTDDDESTITGLNLGIVKVKKDK